MSPADPHGPMIPFWKAEDSNRSTETSLAPSSKYDFTFGFGGGLGYGFSQISDIYVSEMSDLVLHPSNGASTTAPRLFQFRAGFRVGF